MAHQERGVALGKALLNGDPVGVALVRHPDGPTVEGTQAAQPRYRARRVASFAERGNLKIELGHVGSVARIAGPRESTVWRIGQYPSVLILVRGGAEAPSGVVRELVQS